MTGQFTEAERQLEELDEYAAELEGQVSALQDAYYMYGGIRSIRSNNGDSTIEPAMRLDRLLLYERNRRLIQHQRKVFRLEKQPAANTARSVPRSSKLKWR